MRKTLPALLALTFALLLTACGSPVNKANYDKINTGMTVAEVEAILGKPADTGTASGTVGSVTGTGQKSTWTDGTKKITVMYANGKVAMKTQENL